MLVFNYISFRCFNKIKQNQTAIEQNDDALSDEINKAHVVCIVYSVEDESALDRITQHWLPLIRDAVNGPPEQRKPVVLVGNKIDLIDYSTIDVSWLHSVFFWCNRLL